MYVACIHHSQTSLLIDVIFARGSDYVLATVIVALWPFLVHLGQNLQFEYDSNSNIIVQILEIKWLNPP